MKEITRIHLGRQPFTIAVDAHKALETYLAEIKKQVGNKASDVVEEVELRMAELLSERGITDEKTILIDDVEFLKTQLGHPKDFKEDDDETQPSSEIDATTSKRLFRDPEHGMVAGVAAGLANYLNIDVLLVRLVLLVTIFTGGWGILLYAALWLLVPPAKSSSERLQMQGKSVTIDNLKEVVERADLQGTAHRAGSTVGAWINSVFKVALKVSGIALILTALSIIFALMALVVYLFLHDGKVSQEGFFPIGTSEQLLVIICLIWVGLTSLFLILLGLAMVRRKWPIASWATGVVLGLMFVGLAAGTALTADSVPKIQQRFEAAHHSSTRTLQPFTNIDLSGIQDIRVEYGSSFAVTMRYIDKPDISKIKTTVVNNNLLIDTSKFKEKSDCDLFCFYPDYNLEITVYTPEQPTITSDSSKFMEPNYKLHFRDEKRDWQ